jgi:serine/threonine-protein kinase HipA
MCQALARRPAEKYESEGGPSLAECVRVLRDHSRSPLVDVERLLRWVVFNLVAGNADAHAKNLALVYDERGRPPVLAPFYDLVCTRAYRQLDRRLAMAIGSEPDPGHVALRHWHALATALDIGTRALLGIVSALLDEAKPALERTLAAFREQHGDHPVIGMVAPIVRRNLRRTEQLLRPTQSLIPQSPISRANRSRRHKKT